MNLTLEESKALLQVLTDLDYQKYAQQILKLRNYIRDNKK